MSISEESKIKECAILLKRKYDLEGELSLVNCKLANLSNYLTDVDKKIAQSMFENMLGG